MKINFNGDYRSVQTLLPEEGPVTTGIKENSSTQSFEDVKEKVLSELVKTDHQRESFTDQLPVLHLRANLSPNYVPLSYPEPNRVEPQEVAPASPPKVEPPPTPSIISVKRIREEQSAEKISNIISSVGKAHGITPTLGIAVASVESSLNPKALSQDGHKTKGLFQLKDTTGKARLAEALPGSPYDPYDPVQNAELGIRHLKYLHELFSKDTQLNKKASTVQASTKDSLQKLALAAFNAGEGRVAAAQKRAKALGLSPGEYSQVEQFLPKSTREYVSKVIDLKEELSPLDLT